MFDTQNEVFYIFLIVSLRPQYNSFKAALILYPNYNTMSTMGIFNVTFKTQSLQGYIQCFMVHINQIMTSSWSFNVSFLYVNIMMSSLPHPMFHGYM